MRLRTRVASATLALTMLAGTGASAFAAAPTQTAGAGAAGLVAAVVQALNNVSIAGGQVGLVNVDDSLNNLTALNNILNNSPILNNWDITVTIGDINVIRDSLNNNTVLSDLLNNSLNNVDVNALVGVVVLGGQDLVLLTG
jgi:hypothetical protein